MQLSDSEFRVMDILWERGESTAKELSEVANERIGWNKNTTYTLINRCIKKKAIERLGDNFLCRPLISREEVEIQETKNFLEKIFDGSAELLFASLINSNQLSDDEIERLNKIINEEK